MISQRVRGIYVLSVIFQLLLSQALFWIHFAVFTRFYSDAMLFLSTYVVYSLIVLAGLGVEGMSRREMDSDWTGKTIFQRHNVALRQTFYAAGAIVLFLIATKDRAMSRVFLFSYLPLLYCLLLLTTRTMPDFAIKFFFRRARAHLTLLVGPYRKSLTLSRWLEEKRLLGFEVVGALCHDGQANTDGLLRLGAPPELPAVIQQKKISQVILVEPPADSMLLSRMISECERLGTRLLVVSDLQERFNHKIVYMENGGLHFIALREEPLENPVGRILKRVLDLVVALPMVFLVLPVLMAIVWIMQRFQSPGPLFYVQERSGFQNQPFPIVKFRTMRVDNPDAARQATRDDARIYPAGRWLRKFSLDEFPQFWNVLKGEMSVVGPRPHLKEHNEQFSRLLESYHVRSFVKPGLTGLAQVRGLRGEARDEEMLRERIKSDIDYLENWSFAADVIILMRTAGQIVSPPKTAY